MYINKNIPFDLIKWDEILPEKHSGVTGYALWRVKFIGDIRLRKVEYSPNYKADHWCEKGHIIYCIKGEMTTELKDGSFHNLKEGMTYFVGDKIDAHRSFTKKGVTLFIVD